jgi:hypothetical protein
VSDEAISNKIKCCRRLFRSLRSLAMTIFKIFPGQHCFDLAGITEYNKLIQIRVMRDRLLFRHSGRFLSDNDAGYLF